MPLLSQLSQLRPLPPLSETATDRRRRLRPPVRAASATREGSTEGWPGRLGREPLRLHELVLEALSEVELATRGKRPGDEADFYDSGYEALLPYDRTAVDLTEDEYEVAACWLAMRALPYLQKDELEAHRLAGLLAEVVSSRRWPKRSAAQSLSHSVFNRQGSGQAAFAIASAASAPGYDTLKRVCQHVFRAVVEAEDEDDGAWREPLLTLAFALSVSKSAS